jgi:hypothetical protein
MTAKITDLESWSGHSIGIGAEHIRWAVNSDKWVMQGIGWYGHADEIAQGSNQVVCNWVDKVAINISNNPKTSNAIRLNNCPGDLWVSDPTNNAGGNKYEDETGAWHSVPGTAVQGDGAYAVRQGALLDSMGGSSSGRALAIRIHMPRQGPWEITVTAGNGRIIRSLTGAMGGDFSVALPDMGRGICVVALNQGGKRSITRCVVR